jgi:glycerol-3-phosphate dehydrogenase subunit B
MADPMVVVIGAGVAGTAAAWAAAKLGARVSVLHDRAGASALYSGALDALEWEQAAPTAWQADGDLREFAAALGLWQLGSRTLATREGVLRPALGSDAALLDLTPFAGRRVAVADLERDDWDAPLLARSFAAAPWARRTRTEFVATPLNALQSGYERRIAPYDFASLFDDPSRRQALADAIAKARPAADAWLFGPWLGLAPDTAAAIGRLAGVPVGETTSGTGAAAGARFELARDALLAKARVSMRRARVSDLNADNGGFLIETENEDAELSKSAPPIAAKAVVIAAGGVAAGGIRLTWEPERAQRGFELGFRAPVSLALDGEVLAGSGSLYGLSLESRGLGALERVGIALEVRGIPRATSAVPAGLHVAGDIVAGRPRTALEAAQSGLWAGAQAARDCSP